MTVSFSNNDYIIQPNGEVVIPEVKTDGNSAASGVQTSTPLSQTSEDEYLEVELTDEELDVEDEKETDNEDEDDFEITLEEFKSVLTENEDLAKVLELIGLEAFLNEIDKDGNQILSKEEFNELGIDVEKLEDVTIQDILDAAQKLGLEIPSEEELEGIDLSSKAFNEDSIEKLKNPTTEDVTTPSIEETVLPETYAADTVMPAASAGGYSGGGYSGGGGISSPSNGQADNSSADVAEENKSLDELQNTVRPKKEEDLQGAKDNLLLLENDGGELAQYKTAMESAYEDYSNAIKEADSELSALMDAKREEILNQEKLITQKEGQIANQECLISEYEANLDNLNNSKNGLVQNRSQLQALNSSEVEPSKQAQLQASIASLTSQIEALEGQITEIEEKLEKAKQDLQDMKTGKEDSLDSLQNKLKTLNSSEEGQLGDLQEKVNNLIEKNPEIKEFLDKYNEQKEIYETQKASLTEAARNDLKAAQDGLIKTDGLISQKQIEEANKTYSPKKFTQPDLFDSDIKLSIQEFTDGPMPYLLIAPEGADPNQELPVLFYLHGLGQVGKNLASLQQHEYDPSVFMQSWGLNNFNGYIVCPLLKSGNWCNTATANNIQALYDNFSSTHAVDKDKVAVAGASLGAMGALYMANALGDDGNGGGIFKKAAAFSPYNPGNLQNGMKIPTKAFVGSNDDRNSINFANGTLKGIIGQENYYVMNGQTHNSLPAAALSADNDGNGCSDTLEWLFS